MQIDVRQAAIETKRDFAFIVEDANAWQKARGSEAWAGPFDDEWMLPRIERGELFLAYAGAAPVSAFRVLWEDHPFWGDREVGDSIYLHTFAVRRSCSGRGIGPAVIEQVAIMGQHSGRAKLRLDCFLANTRLISFYERNLFASVGVTSVKGRLMNLMERAI
ncbi:GNAT family N-acetyltransferase [Sphingomonas sp. BK481]|jgi:GNAT superfamily N-acetyltransferase|uniref:GNAT family N-acetyltransferase n=1 Tax=Sphingomonas sp. BK481 TaxID=2586981 RepID=UPI0016187E98|nr:GNAT family N-acetyltransferase [Sphingomonas sp. BK481]MBB3588944.1 GNAT superfamily N-acetyltransferase [Sphingomonas sp. BK481]